MKKEQIISEVMKGKPLMVAEVRRSHAEVMAWTDRKSGQRRQAVIVKHAMETPEDVLEMTEWPDVPEGQSPEAFVSGYKPQFPKGTHVLVSVNRIERNQGLTKVSGELIPLEN